MAFCTYQESIGSYETLASPRCKGCGGECTVETKHVFFTGKNFTKRDVKHAVSLLIGRRIGKWQSSN